MRFFAQAALGANPETVTDDQHADHQFWINRRTPRVAVVIGQMLPQVTEIKKPVNAAQKVILGNVFFEIEGVEQYG